MLSMLALVLSLIVSKHMVTVKIVPPSDAVVAYVEMVSEDFYRSSVVELQGKAAWLTWRDIPGGDYTVRATISTPHGEQFKEQRVFIR